MNTQFAALCCVATICACGSITPDAPEDDELLDGPIAGLTNSQMRLFLDGDEDFARVFAFSDGLGPVFNAPSCASCHPGDGRAHPEFGFTRFGRYDGDTFDPMRSSGGPQLQDRAIPGYVPESVPSSATGIAVFLAPPVTGLGLLESIDDEVLMALEDPTDADGDGISGRIHWIPATDDLRSLAAQADSGRGRRMREHDGHFIGRFGRRASNINLRHQTVGAYNNDMGITSDALPIDPVNPAVGVAAADAVPDPEVDSADVGAVTFYLRTLRAPVQRTPNDSAVVRGEELFGEVGCAACHVPTLTTGHSTVEPLSNVVVKAYTDLLLHDMGDGLNDGYAEGQSVAGEWRTPPLWGLGLASTFQGGQPFLLHDGRAHSISQAIGFHGGEAAASREAFDGLTSAAKDQLLSFLESL